MCKQLPNYNGTPLEKVQGEGGTPREEVQGEGGTPQEEVQGEGDPLLGGGVGGQPAGVLWAWSSVPFPWFRVTCSLSLSLVAPAVLAEAGREGLRAPS